MTARCLTLLLLWVTLLSAAPSVSAHPHVYVDASLTFHIDESGLRSMEERWLFDEIFTNAILADVDLTAETLALTSGQETIKKGAFAYLANYGYFTFIENGGKRIPITEVTNFRASLSDGRLVYEFSVPIGLPFDQVKDFRAAVFDKDYYTDILLVKEALRFKVDGGAQVSHTVLPAKDQKYWQFIVPEAVHLSLSASPGGATDLPAVADAGAPGLMERLMSLVRTVQKELTLRLNGLGMDIKADPLGSALWLFLGLSFLYGVVHAVGPGHGKTVVCSYFLANPGSLWTGALMGNAITFAHMGSAAAAVTVAYLIFSTGMGGFAEASRALQPASYGLLALMGLVLFAKAVLDVIRGRGAASNGCSPEGEAAEERPDTRKVLTVALITGLVPCPGAAVILAFSIGQNILPAGIAALVVMAAGMGLTTTLFAWGAVAARSATLGATRTNRTAFRVLRAGLSLCGAAAIAIFGAVLFAGSTGWH
ncbi:DUF1007 family protein [Pseudodesulfovibrio cashew]|uniref:Nickel/cobalt efflux system n=1 Tax=Pseudodesulfovibrio cashew TaxID=2678688 RepID=A0A6I6JEX6_9BACT|nr:DUF1007 family protein [Pseudodesulfovibrio cashew]QGY39729.1 DUF1007 family protein [Pseudodesulfovibrio cashew]